MSKAFARSLAMIGAISALISSGLTSLRLSLEIDKLGTYKSRGKGRGKTSYSKGRHNRNIYRGNTYWNHPGNGEQECTRRRKQCGFAL